MASFKINDGVVIDYSDSGWNEFVKWIDGTYAKLNYTWVDEGLAYAIVAIDDKVYRTCSINKSDATAFEASYKTTTPVAKLDAVGNPVYKLAAPEEADGKPNFVPVPFTAGLYMFVTAYGDSKAGGVISRGDGVQMRLDFTQASPATQEAVGTFHECVEMHDGHVDFDPAKWGFDDKWSVFVRIPATPVTPNGGGTGNCNIAAAAQLTPWDSGTTYVGGELVTHNGVNYVAIAGSTNDPPPSANWLNTANVIVPAAGDGAYDVVLADAIAIPYTGGGYWDYDPWDDVFTPSATPGYANWMLFDFAQDDVHLVKNMVCSSRLGYWELDAYKVEPIYARWQFVLSVTRDSVATRGNATIGGHYTCFRETTT